MMLPGRRTARIPPTTARFVTSRTNVREKRNAPGSPWASHTASRARMAAAKARVIPATIAASRDRRDRELAAGAAGALTLVMS